MQNEPVVGVAEIGFRHGLQQFSFHLRDIFSRCKTKTIAKTKEMRVNCNGGLTEDVVQNNIGGFSADAGKGFQGRAIMGHL